MGRSKKTLSKSFQEYLDKQIEEAKEEARKGKPYSGTTYHGYYAYHNMLDKLK